MRSVHQPKVIYVKSFAIRPAASQSDDSAGAGRLHFLGSFRGGEGNTVIGRHREQHQEDTLAKVPGVLQNELIEDLSDDIAPAAHGDGAGSSHRSWILTGEFDEVDAGCR